MKMLSKKTMEIIAANQEATLNEMESFSIMLAEVKSNSRPIEQTKLEDDILKRYLHYENLKSFSRAEIETALAEFHQLLFLFTDPKTGYIKDFKKGGGFFSLSPKLTEFPKVYGRLIELLGEAGMIEKESNQ